MDVKKIAWIEWNRVLATKKAGGLGVGSLLAGNLSLLAKWWWRYKTEVKALWRSVVCSIHKGTDFFSDSKGDRSMAGCWNNIKKIDICLRKYGISLESLFIKKVGNGESTKFWTDIWLGEVPFSILFSRLYALENDRSCYLSQRLRRNDGIYSWEWSWRRTIRSGREEYEFSKLIDQTQNVQILMEEDKWAFRLGHSGVFAVHLLRQKLDEQILSMGSEVFKWNNSVPIKVNIFIWRMLLNKLPTKVNLNKKGVGFNSMECVICGNLEETAQHLFVDCSFAKKVWDGIAKWCRLSTLKIDCIKDFIGISSNLDKSKEGMKLLDAIIWSSIWCLWKARNDFIFNSNSLSVAKVLDEIMVSSYLWIKNRQRGVMVSWVGWCCNPMFL